VIFAAVPFRRSAILGESLPSIVWARRLRLHVEARIDKENQAVLAAACYASPIQRGQVWP
jgi:hypothetical protein